MSADTATGQPSAARAKPRPTVSPWLIAVTVGFAAFMEVLDISIANVALQHIAGSLAASRDEATWVLTSYLVTNAVVLPMSVKQAQDLLYTMVQSQAAVLSFIDDFWLLATAFIILVPSASAAV